MIALKIVVKNRPPVWHVVKSEAIPFLKISWFLSESHCLNVISHNSIWMNNTIPLLWKIHNQRF